MIKLDKDEYIIGYTRITGGALVLTNSRLMIDRRFSVFGKKALSIRIKNIIEVNLNKNFLFGTNADIKYLTGEKEHQTFFEFTDPIKAKEITEKIRSLKKGEIFAPMEVPQGELGEILLEEAEKIALDFMDKRSLHLKVDEIKHIAGVWNVILSNHERYVVVVGDDGIVEAWKKIAEKEQ